MPTGEETIQLPIDLDPSQAWKEIKSFGADADRILSSLSDPINIRIGTTEGIKNLQDLSSTAKTSLNDLKATIVPQVNISPAIAEVTTLIQDVQKVTASTVADITPHINESAGISEVQTFTTLVKETIGAINTEIPLTVDTSSIPTALTSAEQAIQKNSSLKVKVPFVFDNSKVLSGLNQLKSSVKLPAVVIDTEPAINELRNLRSELFDTGKNRLFVDVSGTVVSLQQAENELKKFRAELLTATDPDRIKQLNFEIQRTQGYIRNITSGKFGDIKKGANEATFALTNTGRVLQDLPFGFVGIANNLNPLLESFQRLKAETGSTSGALKAMVGSLSGGGGIGLALSAVTAIVTFATAGFGAWTRGMSDSKKGIDSNKDALKEFTVEADRAKASIKGLTDELAFSNRLGAIDIKILGLGDLVDLREQSIAGRDAIGKLEDQIDELNAKRLKLLNLPFDLSFPEKAKAAREELVKLTRLNLDGLNPIDAEDFIDKNLPDAVKKATDDVNKALSESEAERTKLAQEGRILYRQIALQKVEDQKEADKKLKDLMEKQNAETIRLAKAISKEFIIPFKIQFSDFDSKSEELAKAKKIVSEFFANNLKIKIGIPLILDEKSMEALVPKFSEPVFKRKFVSPLEDAYNKGLLEMRPDETAIENITRGTSDDLFDALEKKFFPLFRKLGAKLPEINFNLAVTTNEAALQKQLDKLRLIKEEVKFVAEIVANDLASAFTGIIDAIVEGQNPIKAFLNGIKQAVVDVIKQLIAAAVKALILKVIIGTASGGGGAGLFSGGGAGLASNIARFASDAGRFFSGNSTQRIIVEAGSFRLSGNDIYGSLVATQRTIGRAF